MSGPTLLEQCVLGCFDWTSLDQLACRLGLEDRRLTEEKVGNGGFSVRRVRSFLRVLESRRYFVEPAEYWHKFAARYGLLTRLVNTPRRYLKKLIFLNDVHWHVRMALQSGVHEDRFWAEYAHPLRPGLPHSASRCRDALRFRSRAAAVVRPDRAPTAIRGARSAAQGRVRQTTLGC
jgi:Protein of unknown function (DUF5672)